MGKGWMHRNGAVCLLFMGMLLAGAMLNQWEVSVSESRAEEREVSAATGKAEEQKVSAATGKAEEQEVSAATGKAEEQEISAVTGKAEEQEVSAQEDQTGERETSGTSLAPRVALTFDDGPHPTYTAQLLDGLKERGVSATFFVVGENIPGNEELIRRMVQEGHLIGNHTYSHVNLKNLSDEAACLELTKTNQLLEEITGQPAAYVRPPFGNWKDSLDSLVSMIVVKWTVDSLDWNSRNTAEIVSSVLTDAADGDIILMHDYYDTSVEAALEIVDRLQAEGYEFVTVENLILE